MAICMVLVIAFSSFFYRTSALKHLDSVFLFESTLSILDSGHPTSRTVASWPEALKTLSVPSELLCHSDLERPKLQAYNILDNHAYTALYPISLLTALTNPEGAFAILNALAHVLLFVAPFVFLRGQGVGVLPSLVFVLCILLYPAWTYSAVGDYYLDRLYMPFALLSLYFMYIILHMERDKDGRLLVGFVAFIIVGSLFSERAAIMLMGEIAFFMVFFPRMIKASGVRNYMLLLLALLGAYLYVYFKFVFEGIEGGGSLLGNALPALLDPLQRMKAPGMQAFFLVNMLSIGFFILFSDIRYAVLVIAAMIPNLLISVGGAELNGWSTHYHAMYLPFLIFVASIGYLRLAHYFSGRAKRFMLPLWVGGYVFLMTGFLDPYTGRLDTHFLSATKNGVLGKISRYYFDSKSSSEKVFVDAFSSLSMLVPQEAKVSAVEGAMPALYKSRSLSLYPINMDSADYLVISGATSAGQLTAVSGAISYLGQTQMEMLNQCLLQRINAKGFVLFKEIPAIGVLVFKHLQSY